MSSVLSKRYWLPMPIPSSILASTKKDICSLTQTFSTLPLCARVYICTNTTHPYMAVLYTHTGQLCTHVQTLTGHTGVEIMPPKCFKYLGKHHVELKRKKDMITCVEVGEHPVFPLCGRSAAECFSLDGVWSNFENTKWKQHITVMSRQGHTKYVRITEKLSYLVSFSLNINVKD